MSAGFGSLVETIEGSVLPPAIVLVRLGEAADYTFIIAVGGEQLWSTPRQGMGDLHWTLRSISCRESLRAGPWDVWSGEMVLV